jgi:GNAT superfamily N-acetyltransferase
MEDLPAIKEIEKKIIFSRDQDHIDISVPQYIEEGPKEATLGAEVDGKLVGFLIGRTAHWEYGSSSKTGWVVAMGVLPELQGSGIGKMLGNKIIEYFKKVNAQVLKVIVDWDQSDLIAYFKGLGFVLNSEMILQMDL